MARCCTYRDSREGIAKDSVIRMSSMERKRLIIVSNRLPVSVKKVDGMFQSTVSSGGLVTSLSGLTKSTSFSWFGWPGIEVNNDEEREKVSKSLSEHNAFGIFLDSKLADEHYNQFSSIPQPSSRFMTERDIITRMNRHHSLASSALPVWDDLRRCPVVCLQESQRDLRRRHCQRSHQGHADLGPRLSPHAAPWAHPGATEEDGPAVCDWLLAAYALSGRGFLAGLACAQ